MNAEIRAVQRRERHIAHRLKSIAFDARRLEGKLSILEDALADTCDLHFYANERCGSWYLPARSYFRRRHELLQDEGPSPPCPNGPTTCYFKSSDGHYGKWSFSTSRLNLACLRPMLVPETSARGGGNRGSVSVMVDATQHGKSFPDALSKTVPIWACVMNEVFFFKARPSSDDQFAKRCRPLMPPWLHESEVHSIIELLSSFVASFGHVCPAAYSPQALSLQRPLMLRWLHAEQNDEAWSQAVADIGVQSITHHVLVLVCASGDAKWGGGDEASPLVGRQGWSYIRGAADDHQSWGIGLSCDVFWQHVDDLTKPTLSPEDVEAAVTSVVRNAEEQSRRSPSATVSPRSVASALVGARSTRLYDGDRTVIRAIVADVPVLLSSPEAAVRLLENGAQALSVSELPVLIALTESRRRDPQPRVLQFPILGALVLDVDCATKFGIQRAVPVCIRWMEQQRQQRQTAPLDVVIMCSAPSEDHIVAAVAVALMTQLNATEGSCSFSKATIRSCQAVVADALGPRCIHRSDVSQLCRYFLSKEHDNSNDAEDV